MSEQVVLSGLDGANPLGFLAAIGTLRTLARGERRGHLRMHWRRGGGGWCPVLSTPGLPLDQDQLIERLHNELVSMRDHPAFGLGDDLSVSPGTYRDYAIAAADSATPESSIHAEFAAAFASESISNEFSGKNPAVEDTALRTMSGAGHQHFLGFMRELTVITTTDDLRHALFEKWAYRDSKPSLRWDPEDDRRYALRWKEPSSDPIRTVRGANRLAIEALPLIPVMPTARSLETTGFFTNGSRGTYWTWPIWEAPISLHVVRSTLSLGIVQSQDGSQDTLKRCGVVARYRSQRLTIGKYRNFTMGQQL